MLRTFADVRGADALAVTALAIEAPLAVESVECAEPVAAPPAPALPKGLRRTALFVTAPVPAPAAVPEEGMDRTSEAAVGRRVDRLGVSSSADVDPAEPGCEPEPAAQERAGACPDGAALCRPHGGAGRGRGRVNEDRGRAGERRESIGYDRGEAARSLENNERRPSQKIGRLCARQLPAYMQRAPGIRTCGSRGSSHYPIHGPPRPAPSCGPGRRRHLTQAARRQCPRERAGAP
jgi:hypothetical protein